MSITATNPLRTNHRARRVGQAVISAYIHELAAPARPASPPNPDTEAAEPNPVGDLRTAGARRRGDCQSRTFPRPRLVPVAA
jgi:hypothetical protein